MSYLVSDLMIDVLPRISRSDIQSGITLYQAATSVQSLINKRLIKRKSDLVATGDLALVIAAQGCSATLPDDFVAMAEKPKSQDIYTDWMAGTVTSYSPITGALVVNVTQASGSETLSSWDIANASIPGTPSTVIGTSLTSIAVGTGSKSFTATLGMSLLPGAYIIIVPSGMPADLTPYEHHLDPSYLNDDEHDDYHWWEWYVQYGESYDIPARRPHKYKIIGDTIYLRPKVLVNVQIIGKYYSNPSPFSQMSDVLPWNGQFDEVFREGVVRILSKGIAIPSADQDFVLFLAREIDTVVDARAHLIPNTRRLKRGTYI
jgi:hypothetical protein